MFNANSGHKSFSCLVYVQMYPEEKEDHCTCISVTTYSSAVNFPMLSNFSDQQTFVYNLEVASISVLFCL